MAVGRGFTEQRLGRFLRLALIVTLVGAIPIVIFVLLNMGKSEKVSQAETYLRNDSTFRVIVGEIEGHDFFVSDKLSLNKTSSYMKLGINGSKRDVDVILFFKKDVNKKWVIERYEIR